MLKIALIQFTSNLAVSISWKKRQDFKKWDKVVVWVDEVKMLLRLWCKLLAEKELVYKTDKKVLDTLFKEVKVEETPKVEDEVIITDKTAEETETTAPQKVEETETKTEDEVETPKVETTEEVKVEETETEKGA